MALIGFAVLLLQFFFTESLTRVLISDESFGIVPKVKACKINDLQAFGEF